MQPLQNGMSKSDVPRFSRLGETGFEQVVDVEPITVFGKFKNGSPIR